MRAVIDGTPLLLRSAGVKTYLHHWIQSLSETAGLHSLAVFPYVAGLGRLNHDSSNLSRTGTVARLALIYGLNCRFLNTGGMTGWFTGPADLFHVSQNLAHPPRRLKLTATLYDMTCWTVPETHTTANIAATKAYTEWMLQRADAVIAISESSRADAIRILRFPESKIHCVYPGVADTFFAPPQEEVRNAQAVCGLKKPYVLYVGAIEPRKNIDRLLDAWARLKKDVRAHYELVIAGPEMWASPQTKAHLAGGLEGVRRLGYISELLLPGLTAGAYAFAYPSLYEGFGLPLAQALAAGVPAITSDRSSLPEVAQQAALLVDPLSTDDIRSALEMLLTSPAIRDRLARAARPAAERFRWANSARRTWNVFEQVCGAGSMPNRSPIALL